MESKNYILDSLKVGKTYTAVQAQCLYKGPYIDPKTQKKYACLCMNSSLSWKHRFPKNYVRNVCFYCSHNHDNKTISICKKCKKKQPLEHLQCNGCNVHVHKVCVLTQFPDIDVEAPFYCSKRCLNTKELYFDEFIPYFNENFSTNEEKLRFLNEKFSEINKKSNLNETHPYKILESLYNSQEKLNEEQKMILLLNVGNIISYLPKNIGTLEMNQSQLHLMFQAWILKVEIPKVVSSPKRAREEEKEENNEASSPKKIEEEEEEKNDLPLPKKYKIEEEQKEEEESETSSSSSSEFNLPSDNDDDKNHMF